MSDDETQAPTTTTTPDEILRDPTTPPTRDDYAREIKKAYRDTVRGIFRMGDLLIDAKEDLDHGEFEEMIEEDLPFSPSTARKLKKIAQCARLRDRSQANDLPASWSTLYQLATLDRGQWLAIRPHVSPDLQRKDVRELLDDQTWLPLTSGRHPAPRQELAAALGSLPQAHRDWLEHVFEHAGVSLPEQVRVAKALAAVDAETRAGPVALDDLADPPKGRNEGGDAQRMLPGVAADVREAIQEWDDLDGGVVEGARAVLALQAMIRWAMALVDRIEPESVTAGFWVTRRPRKIAEDLRRLSLEFVDVAKVVEHDG